MALTKEEKGILTILRFNKLFPRDEIKKEITIGSVRIIFNWRSSKNAWGRFGGGWNWELGFQIGGSSIILNLLICSLRFIKEKK